MPGFRKDQRSDAFLTWPHAHADLEFVFAEHVTRPVWKAEREADASATDKTYISGYRKIPLAVGLYDQLTAIAQLR